jgi:hypothetical protein
VTWRRRPAGGLAGRPAWRWDWRRDAARTRRRGRLRYRDTALWKPRMSRGNEALTEENVEPPDVGGYGRPHAASMG